MLSGIREILIISTPHDTPNFQELLGNGERWGINIKYAVQSSPDGLAQAFILGEKFLDGGPSALVLGDNIFYGHDLNELLRNASSNKKGATVFAYHVNDPERYGVISFDKNRCVTGIEEKPENPSSNYAVTGLYFYDAQVVEIAKTVKPSNRGEVEITDINKFYLSQNELHVELMGRGFSWLDTGTHNSMLEASTFIATIERRQGLKIACPEEIAYRSGWINKSQLEDLAKPLFKSGYGAYLVKIVEDRAF
jgi:glucose-1-phosphate thymidylyltransferase